MGADQVSNSIEFGDLGYHSVEVDGDFDSSDKSQSGKGKGKGKSKGKKRCHKLGVYVEESKSKKSFFERMDEDEDDSVEEVKNSLTLPFGLSAFQLVAALGGFVLGAAVVAVVVVLRRRSAERQPLLH